VELGDENEIKKWIEGHPAIEFEDMSIGELRKCAKLEGIKNYYRLPKHKLIEVLENGQK
jgi:hypothetical protein